LVTLVTRRQPRARAIDQQRGVRTYWVLDAYGVNSGFQRLQNGVKNSERLG